MRMGLRFPITLLIAFASLPRPISGSSQGIGGKSIKAVLIGLLLSLVFLLDIAPMPIVVFSQSNSPQSPVEISGEPRHHPKFENEFVRVWDVTVPAGDATLWHIHRNDNVVVTLAEARLRIEALGAAPVEAEWKFGAVRFSKATYIHRAINIGDTPFRNLTIELLKPTAFVPDLSTLPKQAGREPVFENGRVRVYRLSLAPGESTGMHSHSLPGLVVAITGGKLEITTEGKRTTDGQDVTAADVRWRAGATTHSIKNVGATPFEAVDIELK
jgi:quercetin dioxygenase-like cupin family protein